MRFLIAFLATLIFMGNPGSVLAQSSDEVKSETSQTATSAEEKVVEPETKAETTDLQPAPNEEKNSGKVKSKKKTSEKKQKKQK